MPSVEVDVDVLVALLAKGALAAIEVSEVDVVVDVPCTAVVAVDPAASVIEVDEELLVAVADMP